MTLRNRVLIGWKIFYGDGSTITSKESKWQDCEQKGVQAVKMFYKSDSGIETNILHNQEYYILNDLLEISKEVKIGRAIEGFRFYEILHNAEFDNEIVEEML